MIVAKAIEKFSLQSPTKAVVLSTILPITGAVTLKTTCGGGLTIGSVGEEELLLPEEVFVLDPDDEFVLVPVEVPELATAIFLYSTEVSRLP